MKTESSAELKSKLKHYRLNEGEYQLIQDLLGRKPEGVEWALFSALWSEHCSYKSSRVHLKKFFSKSPRVLQSFGENAGVIDLGEGEKVAFKMESHNHPSFIEPYQGAATGVGGILRDIFTMGARPIALANYLCFGEPQAPRMSSLVDGVVRGIGGYGNCVGVPTVTGQAEFHKSYNGNILVNALAVGYFGPNDPVVTSQASGVGNYVVYVGAKTGRDGVHGASMASESFDSNSESKKPTIQIGDPFFEKLLIESCLEVMQRGLVVAIQDMGAAGLTSSSFEMAAKGNVGFKIDLNKVPKRDASIQPEEVLLSESQERMLLICEPSKFAQVKKVFETWDLDAEVIGEVTKERIVELYWGPEKLTAIDPYLLTENAPMYQRPYQPWHSPRKQKQLAPLSGLNVKETLFDILSDVRGCSRDWIYGQYDQRVGGSTIRDCASSVAAIRLKASGRAMGLVLGCRPHIMRMDAQIGGQDALVYPALELAAKGFEPLALTDCLNFGNPEKPELMSEFVASVEALSRAAEKFQTPVISGNVSFYNETLNQNVTSTPSTGVVGLKATLDMPTEVFFKNDQNLYLLQTKKRLQAEGLFAEMKSHQPGHFSGEIDLSASLEMSQLLQKWVSEGRLATTRVVGKFGLGYALARMGLEKVGARIDLSVLGDTDDVSELLFREDLYQVVIASHEPLPPLPNTSGLKLTQIGQTGGAELEIETFHIPISQLKAAYWSGWRKHFEVLA